MSIARILFAAPKSGSGKTLITCGILNLLKRRGLEVSSFKCGPDYIDPMFHQTVLGIAGRNLDPFFTDPDTTCYLFEKHTKASQIAVMEGVMGYYDGLAGTKTRASTYDMARITNTPVILVADAKGASVSLAALIRGFRDYREDSHIEGVILNRLSPMMYSGMKELIERETGIAVLGYVPVLEDFGLESRHLGLILPGEVPELKENLNRLSDTLEKTCDIDRMMKLASGAGEITFDKDKISTAGLYTSNVKNQRVRIGLAKDEAFCFFYQDNLELLEDLGAVLVPFSLIHDRKLPDDLDGLLLYGGYPELYARELSENKSMMESVRTAIQEGLLTVAECGGFMYLHREMEDMERHSWPMTGVIDGKVSYTGSLSRFGYITLNEGSVFGEKIGPLTAHEFHYFDSTSCGNSFHADKPESSRHWKCVHSTDTLFAGFPHLYYYGNPAFAKTFIDRCHERRLT